MASTAQLTHICSKGCSWRDVNFVYKNTVYHSTLSFTAIAFREISSTAALYKLLLAIEIHVQPQRCRRLCRLGDESQAGPRRFPPSAMALEWPWSYPGQSTVESEDDALKTGRVTGALVQCPKFVPVDFTRKLCPRISQIGLADESPARPRRFLPSAMALEWPWSHPGQSTVESGGDALKTGRVTGALVQCPKFVPVYFTRSCARVFTRSCAHVFHKLGSRTRAQQALDASSH